MRIQKEQDSITVDFSVGEWHGVIKDDPKKFVDVVNAIADGGDYITFPPEDCFGDVKGGFNTPVDPTKVVEENREGLLKEIETLIGPNITGKEKEEAMKRGEKIIDNLANLELYRRRNNLNISNEDDLNKLRKKIAEIMEEED